MRHLSLGYLSIMDVTPAEMVSVAAQTGYQGISLAAGESFLPAGMEMGLRLHSVIEDAALRRETVTRARDTGVSLDQMEGFILSPVLSLERCRMAMDITAEMGIPQVATFDAETDSVRASEYLEALCEMAAERDLKICIEFHSRSKLRSIAAAAKLASEGRYRGLKILIDALHLARGGETPADVAQVPPALIDCVQFCDGPLLSPGGKAYGYEAMFERQVPGAGELPLVALLKSIPQEAFIYLEVPQRAAREQGLSAIERAQRAMDGMRSVIAAAG